MKKKPPIVCISNTTWRGAYTKSSVQLLSLLARNREVLFVEYPFTWKDILTTLIGRQKAPVQRMLGRERRLQVQHTSYGTEVYQLVMPPVLPVDFITSDRTFELFFRLNIRRYRKQLQATVRQLGMEQPVVITSFNPFYGLPLMGSLQERLHLYYCYDGIGPRRHGPRIYERDRRFSEAVDAIVVSSDPIREEKSRYNKHCYVVKNGVDFDRFSAFATAQPRPASHSRKIGYLGSMDHRFDIDCVEQAVRQLPDYTFEFTGSLRNAAVKRRLQPYANVSFRPPVSPEQVPALMADCDAGIIPYQVNELNKNIYPLKINEYLAVGVPVVMTPFAALPEFEPLTLRAGSPFAFAKAIQEAVATDSPAKRQERIAFARGNSWQAKADAFDQILDQLCTIPQTQNKTP